MTCSSAAVEPTSDSALPIRAELFGGPKIVGTWPPLSPKIKDFRGPHEGQQKIEMTCSSAAVEPTSDSALPIRAKLFGGPEREDGDIISCQ